MAAEIIECERVTHPPVRFIGKRFESYPDWSQAWANDWFGQIEKAGATAAINDDSYCVLTGVSPEGAFEFYLGEFFPAETPVPDGFDHADLPEMSAALFYTKGMPDEVYAFTAPDKRAEVAAAFAASGCAVTLPAIDETRRWLSFERDNCPRFTDPDADGRLILDYAIYL